MFEKGGWHRPPLSPQQSALWLNKLKYFFDLITKNTLSKELYAKECFDIILLLWPKLFLRTLHNKNGASDEKNALFRQKKNSYYLKTNQNNNNNNNFFFCNIILNNFVFIFSEGIFGYNLSVMI